MRKHEGWILGAAVISMIMLVTVGGWESGVASAHGDEDKVTGGGCIMHRGKGTFGFVVMQGFGRGELRGHLTFVFHGDPMLVLQSTSMTSLSVTDDHTRAVFSGTARVNQEEGFTFRVRVEDNGEPGIDVDKFRIQIYDRTGRPGGCPGIS